MPVKVSVVIATYNSGPALDRAMASLDAQSLPTDEFEIILVDDGSTDDTVEHLRRIAADRPHVLVDQIPNSGWPGRPRNVGTARATGEYVLYLDHDDDIFPEALARMYDYAVANRADVLLGKEVMFGDGRTPGWPTWRTNRPDVPVGHELLHCMTPHKLYRRALIESVPLRYPEGAIRLEDQYWNAAAYAAGRRFAILADYPCYRWYIHPANSHRAAVDLEVYFSSFYHSLEPIEALPAGRRRDELLKRPYVRVVLARLSSPNSFRDRFRADAPQICSHFPNSVDAILEPVDRLRSALYRRQAWEALDRLSPFYAGFTLRMSDTTAHWEDGALQVSTHGLLVLGDGQPYPVTRDADGLRLRLPELSLTDPLEPAVTALDESLARAYVDLSVYGRGSGVEWPVVSEFTFEVEDMAEGSTVSFRVSGAIDPRGAAMGNPLDGDLWDVMVQFSAFGHEVRRRIPAVGIAELPAMVDGRPAVAFAVPPGNLALDLSEEAGDRLGPDPQVFTSVEPARAGDPSQDLARTSWRLVQRVRRWLTDSR